ncbi:hypothetical protein [Streptomyces litchfieldiae]|uniref:Uncharacterized protein n=1 Tax=Streptomyces litchfieldiae TaxID=3075543 RepID=A0ABU2MMS2_9ACTN|nr:hypothetical protein [Streptomyces sp. DSM 44938]MDT0342904.1 hypothetical protein [Streptomyces sp. DSM 44938]
MREIAKWPRKFQVWQYAVSHSVLLLRSYHPQQYETRIDIAFSDVSLMKLKSSFDSLSVHQADPEEASEILADNFPSYGFLYLLNDGEGYVHAANCSWHEDHGHHKTPSHFGPLRGTD